MISISVLKTPLISSLRSSASLPYLNNMNSAASRRSMTPGVRSKSITQLYPSNIQNITAKDTFSGSRPLQFGLLSFEEKINFLVKKFQAIQNSQNQKNLLLTINDSLLKKSLQQYLQASDLYAQTHVVKSTQKKQPFFINIAGASASGKTTLEKALEEALKNCNQVRLMEKKEPIYLSFVSHDDYFRDNRKAREVLGDKFFEKYDLEDPKEINLDQAAKDLKDLSQGKSVKTPGYNRNEKLEPLYDGKSTPNLVPVEPASIIIFDGLHAIHHSGIRELPGLNVFVDVKPKEIERRWIERAKNERTDIPPHTYSTYTKRILQAYQEFILPCKQHADVVINGNESKESVQEAASSLLKVLLEVIGTDR